MESFGEDTKFEEKLMRILVIGGTGTIGQSVVNELSIRHKVIIAGHEHGEVR